MIILALVATGIIVLTLVLARKSLIIFRTISTADYNDKTSILRRQIIESQSLKS